MPSSFFEQKLFALCRLWGYNVKWSDMMIAKDVKIIEYSKPVEFFNTLTHSVAAVMSVVGLVMIVMKAEGFRETFASAVYGLSLIAVYTVSSIYHGLKKSEAKRIARLIDHMTVPILIAGTATPCTLIGLYRINIPVSILIFVLAWLCTGFGIISKFFFFEKLSKITPIVYSLASLVMMGCAVPLLGQMKTKAYLGLGDGNIFYLIGAFFCLLGVKKPACHAIFHFLVAFASFIHFYVIYMYIF